MKAMNLSVPQRRRVVILTGPAIRPAQFLTNNFATFKKLARSLFCDAVCLMIMAAGILAMIVHSVDNQPVGLAVDVAVMAPWFVMYVVHSNKKGGKNDGV